MRKNGSYRKNKLFCLLAVAVLPFVQSYLNDIAHRGSISNRAGRASFREVLVVENVV